MSTTVTYNGITLGNVLTREFDQSPVDDKSGTDRICYRYHITVETIVSVAAAAKNFGLIATGASAALIEKAARDALLAKRGDFTYQIGNDVLVNANATNDLKNGPNPTRLSITQVTPATLRITWSIEFHLLDCSSDPTTHPVLNNRWSSSDDLDDSFRITRSWHGVLRVATANVSNVSLSAHAFRSLCLPTLQAGYRRTKMSFIVDPTGLELGYHVTDQQMLGDAAPAPATKWSYTHTERFGDNASQNEGTLAIRMAGFPRANKLDMLAFALQMLEVKLLPNGTSGSQATIQNVTIVDHGGDSQNAIDVTASVLRVAPSSTTSTGSQLLASLDLSRWGQSTSTLGIAGYDANAVVQFGPYGTADAATLAGIFASYLQSPCGTNFAMPTGQGGMSGITVAYPPLGTDASAQIAAFSGDPSEYEVAPVALSSEHAEEMYTHVRLESRIELDGLYVGLPIARANSDTADETQVFVRLSAGVARRIIRYEAERIGAWPLLWKPDAAGFTDAQGIRYVLLSWKPIFQAPEMKGDGKTLYSLDAEYVFAMSRPPKDTEPIATVTLPWDKLLPADTAYPADTLTALDDTNYGLQ